MKNLFWSIKNITVQFYFYAYRYKHKKKWHFVQNYLKIKSISFAIIIVQLRNNLIAETQNLLFIFFFSMCTDILKYT